MQLADRSAPWLALLLLALSVILWLALLLAFLHYLLLGPPRALHRVRTILAGGEPRDALIEQAEQTGVHVRGFAQWKLQLGFQNLSGTPINEQMLVVDSKPQLQRFVAGQRIEVRLSRMPGAFPNVVLEGAARTGCRQPLASWCRRSDRHRGGGQCLCGRLSAAE